MKNDYSDRSPDNWVQYHRGEKTYKLFEGDICTVDPLSKSKEAEKIRGSKCKVLYLASVASSDGKAVIQYLDSNRKGRRHCFDLIPDAREPVSFNAYRAENALDD